MTDKQKFEAREINDLVKAGARRAWAEKEPVALIGLLMGTVTVAFFWPAVQFIYTALPRMASEDPAVAEALRQDMLDASPFFLAIVAVSVAVKVVLARLATGGRAEALDGGVRIYAGRVMWVWWRFIQWTLWLFAGVLALWMAGILIGLVIGVLFALFGGGDVAGALAGGPAILLVSVLLVPALGGMLLLYGALGLSVTSEAVDHHLTIRNAWTLLKGQRIKLAAAILVAYVAVMLTSSILGALVPQDVAQIANMRLILSVIYVVTTIIATFFAFVWFSMIAVVAEKVDWSVLDVGAKDD